MLKASDRFGEMMVTLLIVSELDIASTIQGDALLERGGWSKREDVEEGNVWQHDCEDVWLWWFLLHDEHFFQHFLKDVVVMKNVEISVVIGSRWRDRQVGFKFSTSCP